MMSQDPELYRARTEELIFYNNLAYIFLKKYLGDILNVLQNI